MYPRYANEAEVEDNRAATILFRQISKIERQHHDRFKKLLEMVETGNVFKRDTPIRWKCSICGYAHEGLEPPKRCPYCKHPREYYEPSPEERVTGSRQSVVEQERGYFLSQK
jgi:rubrerythrin